MPAELAQPESDPEAVRDAIDEILARPEFAEEQRTLIERAVDAVVELVGRLLDEALAGASGGPFAWVVVAVLTAAALVFAFRFGRGVQRDPGSATAASVPKRSAPDWRAEAERHELAGQWRSALRCRWRALVADLADRGFVEEVPGRTAGEYRRQVNVNAPRAATDFDGATSLFESAWYGNGATGAAEAERFTTLADRVLVDASSDGP